jgi:hypothetical protein
MAQTACVHPRPRGGHQGGHWVGARSGDWREVALRDEGCLTGPVQAMYRRKSVDREATLARSCSHPDDPEQRVQTTACAVQGHGQNILGRKTYKFHDMVTPKL